MTKTIVIFLLSVSAAFSQATPVFPSRTATQNDLMVAVNNGSTTLNTGITSTATSLSVASGTGFIAPGVVTIDSEIIAVCQVSGNTLTIGHSSCPNVDGRGWDGSTAVTHNANRPVQGRVTAGLHNQLAAEVQAVEQATPNQLSDLIGSYTTLAAACADAVTKGLTLALSKAWAPPSGITDCSGAKMSFHKGAMITPASGAVVRLGPVSLAGGSYQVLDTSTAGLGSIVLTQGYAEPGWFGANALGSSHDDTPGINAAMAAVTGATAPVVKFQPGTYWLNSSLPGGVHNVNLDFLSNVTLDLKGTVFATTQGSASVAFGMNPTDSLTPGAGRVTSYKTLFATAHDQWSSPSNDLPVGATQVIISPAANAGNYHKGDAIYLQSGEVISTTAFNSETVLASADGDPMTGIVPFRDPTLHAYTNDSMNPWGLVDVESVTVHNLHIIGATSAKGTNMYLAAMLQCVDCSVDNSNWDSIAGLFTLGQTNNLSLINNTIHVDFPSFAGSGMFQFSTGMTRTYLLNNQWKCTGPTGNGDFIFSEGSAENVISGGEIDGCGFATEKFVGTRILGVKMIIPFISSQIGPDVGTGLVMQGNDILSNGTGSSSPFNVGGPGSQIVGNKFTSPNITAGTPAVSWTNGCGTHCQFQSNTVTGGGLLLASADSHAWAVTGNIFTGQASTGNCILVADNGVQTLPETIANNYCSGFTSDLVFSGFAHESVHSVFSPNAMNDATPYTPASIGSTIPGITGNKVSNLQQINTPICGATPSGTALTSGAEFMFDYGTLCINTGIQIGMIGNAKWDLILGNSSNSNLTSMEYNSATNTWSWNGIVTMSSTGLVNFLRTVKFTGGTQSSTGATGVTSTTCSLFDGGICVAP